MSHGAAAPSLRPRTRWGVTLPFGGVPLRDHRPLVTLAEERGFDDLWTGETAGPDGFTPLAAAATWTDAMRLGTGIVNPFTRGPALLAQQCAALADLSGGRFVLGLGASSNVIVQQWNEVPFERPLTRVRDSVATLREVLAGGRGRGGFRLETAPPAGVPIILAALRGKMLALAAEVGDGAFTNFLPLSGAAQVVGAFGTAEKELVCRFFCVPGPAEEAFLTARRMFVGYATVPVYAEFFTWLGWGEAIAPMLAAWAAGDRRGALELAPAQLVREIFVLGTPEEMKRRLEAFQRAGISTLVLNPIVEPAGLPAFIDALGPR